MWGEEESVILLIDHGLLLPSQGCRRLQFVLQENQCKKSKTKEVNEISFRRLLFICLSIRTSWLNVSNLLGILRNFVICHREIKNLESNDRQDLHDEM